MEPFYRIAALVFGLLLAFAWFHFTSRSKRKSAPARRAASRNR